MATPLAPPDAAARAQLSLERRRRRNREAMQRLRERQQQAVDELRHTAESLATTYEALLLRVALRSPPPPRPSSDLSLTAPHAATRLDMAIQRAQALVGENAQLQRAIDDRVRWEDRIALLLEYLQSEASPPPEEDDLSSFAFDFVAPPRLSEARASELMLYHQRKRKALKKRWVLATRPPYTSQFFGWDIQYFPQGVYWHLKFTKLFRNVTAHEVSQRVWGNAQRLVTYRTRRPSQRIVQHINDNAFVFARWTPYKQQAPQYQSVMYNLRFRIEEPDGTIAVGMQTLPQFGEDDLEALKELDDKASAWGEDVCLCIKLKPVRDAATGEEHCTGEFSGRTQFGGADFAQLNAMEMVISLARWEEVNVATAPVRLVW